MRRFADSALEEPPLIVNCLQFPEEALHPAVITGLDALHTFGKLSQKAIACWGGECPNVFRIL